MSATITIVCTSCRANDNLEIPVEPGKRGAGLHCPRCGLATSKTWLPISWGGTR